MVSELLWLDHQANRAGEVESGNVTATPSLRLMMNRDS